MNMCLEYDECETNIRRDINVTEVQRFNQNHPCYGVVYPLGFKPSLINSTFSELQDNITPMLRCTFKLFLVFKLLCVKHFKLSSNYITSLISS